MKLSSHLYFRSDGSLGRFPIISVSPLGIIDNIEECGSTLRETSHQQFLCGIIVPAFSHPSQALSAIRNARSREDLLLVLSQASFASQIRVGARAAFHLIDTVDLNTFDCSRARITPIKTT